MSFVRDILRDKPDTCTALWISPEFYCDLLEMGLIAFDRDGDAAKFMGLELRVVDQMKTDWVYAADNASD